MNIQTDRALIPAGTAADRYLTITVTAPSRERRTERPAVHVALVLDRSGSMGGQKIDMARQAVEHAIRLLDDRDRLALVCYDTEIDALLTTTAATPEAKALALSRLRQIDARGSTDLCGGWLRGAQELRSRERTLFDGTDEPGDAARRVLLLSDGLANQGETDPDVLARHAVDLRAKGIATSTFGLGRDFDEALMTRLANEGGGNFYFIEQPAQIPDFFTSELGETLDTSARDARVIVGGADDIQVACLNDFPGTTVRSADGTREAHIKLGDLVSGQQVTVTLAVRCPSRPLGARTEITVRLADRDAALFPHPLTVDWRSVSADANETQPINADVLIEVARLIAARARRHALDANRRGDFEGAARIIGDAVAEVRALMPSLAPLQAIADELEAEQAELRVRMDPVLMKQAYFQSRSVAYSRTEKGAARKRS
jgi:Mg-chelatase subunit ChlD